VVQAVELLTMENHLHQVELVTHLLLVLHKEILEEILQTHNQELVVAVVELVQMVQIQHQVVVVMAVMENQMILQDLL
jgi:hypothetical protein|tara:strand:- start:218 stop:451 length:234 start_codon:yes stop_codon:yes gene_type:complete